MKRVSIVVLAVWTILVLLLSPALASEERATVEANWTTQITARFATVEEGQQRMRDRTLFHDQITESMLPFFLQAKGGTLEEYIEYSEAQVMEFTPEEEQRVIDALNWLREVLEAHGLSLPDPGEITFVKTTGQEAVGSAGYTSGGTVFLAWFTFEPEYYTDEMFRELVFHELSQCLSRLFPEYRRALYSLIHFTVLDKDIEIPGEILEQIIANPDVEHHDSYATFTIDGEKKDCYLVFLTDSVFEKAGDDFFSGMYSGIVPLDGSRVYRVDEVEDFWEVVGENTDYVEDPEEAMASNFAFAITHLNDGYDGFKSPEILDGIIDFLKAGTEASKAA
ncbi:MAG: hypothetical protein IJI26_00235 [Clostridia bacterium]|nr:hypothetical protein [Clostridia bacterium]